MLGSSRVSLAELNDSLHAQFDSNSASDLRAAGEGLLSTIEVLEGERALRATLADPSIGADQKTGVVNAILSGKVPELTVSVVREVANSRWSSDSDLVDAIEEAGATLVLMAAEKDGHIDSVEEELFRFGRAIDANPDLQMALTDPASQPEVKEGIVRTLLSGIAADETTIVVAHMAGSLRGRRIQDAIVRLSELAASRRGRVIADVTSAIELTSAQQQRLASALERLHGRQVELNVLVDPSVLGGIEVRVGDEVIDGTAASKLEQARRRLSH